MPLAELLRQLTEFLSLPAVTNRWAKGRMSKPATEGEN